MEKELKKFDKIIYNLIKAMGIIVIIALSYLVLFNITYLLEDLCTNNFYYSISEGIQQTFMFIFIWCMIIIIPYFILSIIICIIFIVKYIKFKGNKKNYIIKTTFLVLVTGYAIIKGLLLMPLTSQYKIDVNTNISNISNIGVKEILQDKLEKDVYVYYIDIRSGFPDDFVLRIYYKDGNKKVKHASLSDNYYEFIKNNAKNITNTQEIKSILMLLAGDILYTYSLIYILKEFKRICE